MLFDSAQSAIIYQDEALTQQVAVLELATATVGSRKLAFSGFSGDAADHLVAVGTALLDDEGRIKSVKGTMVRRGVLNACMSKGKVSGRRIN
jgi:hypothetical protein